MKKDISYFYNKHKNNPALILCHGPQLNELTPKLESIKNKGVIIFGCNEWLEFYDTEPTYWVLSGCMIKQLIKMGYSIKNTIIYNDAIDVINYSEAGEYIKRDYIVFYSRKDDKANRKLKDLDQTRDTIQDQIQAFTGSEENFGIGCNVSVYMLCCAILMGCNPIYLGGVNLDYQGGYADHKRIDLSIDKSLDKFKAGWEGRFDPFKEDFVKQTSIILNSAKKIGIDIYNTNETAWYDHIPYKNII